MKNHEFRFKLKQIAVQLQIGYINRLNQVIIDRRLPLDMLITPSVRGVEKQHFIYW